MGVGWILNVQVGVGETSMITYSAEKFPSYPVSFLFECFFSSFLNACVLSFDVIMINNELCPLVFSHHLFIRIRDLHKV